MHDLRYAARQLLKQKGVSLALILTIALGIGVNTAVFSFQNGLLRPLPVPAPEEIVVLAAETKGDDPGLRFQFSYAALQDFRREAGQFIDLFGFHVEVAGMNTGGKSVQMMYSAVTGNYFSALHVAPALGRLFEPGEGESIGADTPVVLGYAFWQKRFGGDPSVIGRQIRIEEKAATIIGVAQKEFHGAQAGTEMEAYLPLRGLIADDAPWWDGLFTDRDVRPFTVLGRLKPGTSLDEAQRSLSVIARQVAKAYPATDEGLGVRVLREPSARPVPARFLTDTTPVLRFSALLTAALVLLVACMNVANILLAQASARRREMAIRVTLGSGRWRLVRQMLTETLLLACIGGITGILLGQWTLEAVGASLDVATVLPIRLDFTFDWRVLAYASTIALFTGIVIGVWPALRASQAQPGIALHDGARTSSGGRSRQRIQGLLVIGQVAGSLVLLISAGLSVRSLKNAGRVDLGFVADHVLNARLNPRWAGYNIQQTKSFYRELERRVKAWPEVQSVSFAGTVPLGLFNAGRVVYAEGQTVAPGEQAPAAGCNFVDAAYFETMGISIVRGRPFRESDTETSPRVAVVNQTMAKQFWPNENPIGKRFRMQAMDSPLWEVVGVVRDGKYFALFEDAVPFFYVPIAQYYVSMRVLQIRSSIAPELLSSRVEQEIRDLDPNIPVSDLQPMTRLVQGLQGFQIFRVGAIQAGAMGILAMALALVGVHGVVSYATAQRTREIAIRIAVGASARNIMAIVLRQGVWLVLCGVAAGLIGAVALTFVLKRFLLFISVTDPVTFIVVPALLGFSALYACYVPARRATRIDPMEALRHE